MKDFFQIGQGIYALSVFALSFPLSAQAASDFDPRMERAVQHAVDSSISGVRNALADDGYHPFMLRTVSVDRSATERQDQGLLHCALPRNGWRICGRLVARLIDVSPLHFQVIGMANYTLLSAHLVLRDGRTKRLNFGPRGIIDIPAVFQQRWSRFGVTVRGPDGPETGLFLAHEANDVVLSPCTQTEQIQVMVASINRLRLELGATPLRIVEAPQAYARTRQNALRQRFAHPDEGLGTLLRSLDLRLGSAAELLAEDAELGAICEGWMQSPSHRAALLDPRRNRIALVQQGERMAALVWQNP